MLKRTGTVIEEAPNELWREIFEYFDASDLWFSFRGLNERIDAILDLTPLDLDFQRRGTYVQFVEKILPSMNATSVANVRSLFMNRNPEMQHFFSFYPLRFFVQLRHLHLERMRLFDDPTCLALKQLSSLKHLRSLKITFPKSSNDETAFAHREFLVRSIFESGFYPSLRRFLVETLGVQKQKSVIPSLNPTSATVNLRYVSIDSLTYGDLVKILPALGNIKSLRVSNELGKGEGPVEKPPKVDIPLLPKCLQLEVKFCVEHTFEHVEYLLGQVPNVQRLILLGWSQTIDAKKWESLLSTLCPKLLKLELLCLGFIGDLSFGDGRFRFEDDCRVAAARQQRDFKLDKLTDESETVMGFRVSFDFTPENNDS